MSAREELGITVLSFAGVISLAIVLGHGTYLGFNLDYGYPFMAGAVVATLLALRSARIKNFLAGHSSYFILTLVMIFGACLRFIMMANPNASLDELQIYSVVTHTASYNLAGFVQSFNQVAGPFWSETTPFPFLVLKAGYAISPTLQGIRLIPTILSILMIPASYYLTLEFANERVSQLTALLVGINPGLIYFLGAADTDIFVAFFGLVGFLFFVRGCKRSSFGNVVISGILFGIAFWSKSSLPFLWLVVALAFVLGGFRSPGLSKRALYFALVAAVSIGLFLPWAFADPKAFDQSFIAVPVSVAQQLLDVFKLNPGGSGVIVSQSTVVVSQHASIATSISQSTFPNHESNTQVGLSSLFGAFTLPGILPRVTGGGYYSSFADVMAQVPLWFSPVTILTGFSFLLYSLFKREKRMFHVSMLFWIVIIVIPMLTLNRDIRYFIDVAAFPVIFVSAEATLSRSKQFGRALEVILVAFALIFLVIGMQVGYETNGGIAQSTQFVNQQFGQTNVMVNFPVFTPLLSSGDNVSLLPTSIGELNSTLTLMQPDVVMIWNQARTTSVQAEFLESLGLHYAHSADFGPSDFSYVIVYYGFIPIVR